MRAMNNVHFPLVREAYGLVSDGGLSPQGHGPERLAVALSGERPDAGHRVHAVVGALLVIASSQLIVADLDLTRAGQPASDPAPRSHPNNRR